MAAMLERVSKALRPAVPRARGVRTLLAVALLTALGGLGGRGGVVVEGRDTGTVVFPDAGAKFFLTASEAERARRRVDELEAAGKPVAFDDTLREIQERDSRDASRDVAPMRAAEDAVLVDSSKMTLDEVVETLERTVKERAAARSEAHGHG